ncbi:MAG: HD domain-containing protein [Desulfobulbaceae bacterium]|nr:HD domain-containing protein [Desulfobulbaceae bacterium]
MAKNYEIRDPIHGLIKIDEWEREIIDHPVFQRLRRIRQLALTDMIYPGVMHTRFEHSIGVMHVAGKMFDGLCLQCKDFLTSQMGFNDAGLGRDRALVRLTALLHDIGHAPFSHSGEELLSKKQGTLRPYKHEDYSEAAIRLLFKDVIENHPINARNYGISAEDVAGLLSGNVNLKEQLFWRGLISGEVDADRADYLLRDSYHAGVAYGKFDLERLLSTLTITRAPDTDQPTIAVSEGGEHAAEQLIIARYMMFTQLYFHHTRRAFDYHVLELIKHILEEKVGLSVFPEPSSVENLNKFLMWDDWRVLGEIGLGGGGRHGECIKTRKHDRRVYKTHEIADAAEIEFVNSVREKLGDEISFVDSARQSWYKFEKDILIARNDKRNEPLSKISPVVNGLKPVTQIRIYAPFEKSGSVKGEIDELLKIAQGRVRT